MTRPALQKSGGWRPGLALVFALLAASPAGADDKIDYAIGGNYRVRGFGLRGGTLARQLDPTTRLSLLESGVTSIDERQSYLDTRLRLRFTATRGNELSLNTQFEIGDLTFGGPGAQIGTDGVNIETKWLYLDWTPEDFPLSFRAGLYSQVTSQSLILSDDVAGLQIRSSLFDSALNVSLDFIKAVDQSRVDLNNDGIRDNDFNDRDIWLLNFEFTKLRPLVLGAYGMADIDNAQDSPKQSDLEREVYWLGAFLRGQIGLATLSLDGIYAFGDNRSPGNHQAIEGFALDGRLNFDFPYVGLELISGWASGDDPKTGRIEAFPTISTFYAHSNIIFDDYGGYNLTGSNLSGIAHISALLRYSPMAKLKLTGVFVYAVYTADQRVSSNVQRKNLSGRELGIEVGLNADYKVNENLSFVYRSSVFFPKAGFITHFDSPDSDELLEFVLGAELRF